ncbi:hypothetical protein Pyn_14070 [Prunus yedoensis var. nudiflora]|uniref:Uncharacterized protein n=1 Tax=Prunus yedoensis var. nudiflora TaxID=2094558 RepID=A0A314YZ19_PRUYE|nr:hypothetical protein Pyn_14070 [Prunus yedoensis var. nudiflora]
MLPWALPGLDGHQLLAGLDVTAGAEFGRPRKSSPNPISSFPLCQETNIQTWSHQLYHSPSCALDCSSAVGGEVLFCSSDVVYQIDPLDLQNLNKEWLTWSSTGWSG